MTLRRPRNLAEFEALSGFMSDTSLRHGLAYRPESSDIFISPYSKCGTTWMQQIVHGLRTGGSMDFDEITEVVPWLELAYDMGVSVNAEQVAHPRVFKSHLRWDELPKGGRYIIVLRDPVDAMVSLFRFLEGWWFEPGALTLQAFADYYLSRGDDSYWSHAVSWWAERGRENVLLLCFEDMKADLTEAVNRVADFMDAGYGPERRALAARQAGFEFMKAHATQFDDHLVRQARDAACGLPEDGIATKIDKGAVGISVTDDIRSRFSAQWAATMGAEFGLATYDALRADIKRQ